MKIEEVIAIYEFFGKLSVLAFIGITLLILIGILIVILPLREKISLLWTTLLLLESVVLISLIGLYLEARARNKILPVANAIKSNFVITGHTKKTFNQIINLNYMENNDKTLGKLMALPELFPTEFVLIRFYGKTTADSLGLRITDPIALSSIEKKLSEKAVLSSLLIKNYMLANKIDTVYTSFTDTLPSRLIRYIDNEGFLAGQDFFRVLVGRNGLTPVYDTTYSNPEGGFNIASFYLTSEPK